MAQMKRTSFRPKAGKAGSRVVQSGAPARMFRPGNPKPVVDYHRAVYSLSAENRTERKDRLVE